MLTLKPDTLPLFRKLMAPLIFSGLGAVFMLVILKLAAPSPFKIGTIHNKSIFADLARRLADLKTQSPEQQVTRLTHTLLDYSKAVREVSKAHTVILFDQSAVATKVPDYTREVEAKLFGKRSHE